MSIKKKEVMKNEVIDKINKVVTTSEVVIDEAIAIYLMVETRKLIEHGSSDNYHVVKFYCDWVVHIEKDRITPEIKKVIQQTYSSIVYQINNPYRLTPKPATTDFAYLSDFRKQLGELYEAEDICSRLVDNNDIWTLFISQLVKVLENQPINQPIPEVEKVMFLPAADNCVIFRVVFTNPIKDYNYYDYKNAY